MDTINRVHNKMLLKHVSVAVTNTLFLLHLAGRSHEVLMGEVFAKTYYFTKCTKVDPCIMLLAKPSSSISPPLVNAFPDWFNTRTGMRDFLVKRLTEHEIRSVTAAHESEPSKNSLAFAMYLSAQLLSRLNNSTTDEQPL